MNFYDINYYAFVKNISSYVEITFYYTQRNK